MPFNLFRKNKDDKKKSPKTDISVDKNKQVQTIEADKVIKKELLGDSFSYEVIKEPHVSEKSSLGSSVGKYVFKIFPDKNKIEVKKAIEKIYGVKVEKINIINVPAKSRTVGKYEGQKSGYKKAVVTLKEGQSIDIVPR